jgi:hypothetical protein
MQTVRIPVLVAGLVALVAGGVVRGEETLTITEQAPIEKPDTSFGAAVADGWLYAFGGHLGSAHNYSAELQARQLLRLNLA